MVKLISFEGCIGAGKTCLTNFFSREFDTKKILEEAEKNPFLAEFYQGTTNPNLETELTFVLLHYYQIRTALNNIPEDFIISDFSIEKDLVYAELNLKEEEFNIFKNAYDFIVQQIGIPDVVIYLDLSLKILQRRIFQRGRSYELDMGPSYLQKYNEKLKSFFSGKSKSKVHFINVDDLVFDPDDERLDQIREIIQDVIRKP